MFQPEAILEGHWVLDPGTLIVVCDAIITTKNTPCSYRKCRTIFIPRYVSFVSLLTIFIWVVILVAELFFISVDVQYMWNSYIWIYPLHAWIFRASFRYYCVSFSLDSVHKCNDHVKLGFLSCLFPVTRFLLQCRLLIKSRLSHFNSSYCDGRLQQVAWTLPWYDLHFSLSLHYNQNPA